jgi:hypothetical protein
MIVWLIQVEDLSRLGGPMGTETTTVIDVRVAESLAVAKRWVAKDARRRHLAGPIEWNDRSLYVDLGSVGYDLSRCRVLV